MRVQITPQIINNPCVRIPTSKSLAHRAIICASLAEGTSTIHHVDHSVDIDTTIACMRNWGAIIEEQDDTLIIQGAPTPKLQSHEVYCSESGSTLRFMIPIFSLTNQTIHFTGAGRLMSRPMGIYETLYQSQNLFFHQEDGVITTKGAIQPGNIELDGNVSSQFITGLLFVLPLLKKDTTLTIQKPFASKPYVVLTLDMLSQFGIRVEWKDDHTLYIPANQTYQSCTCTLDADDSQAAFFAVLAAFQGPLHLLGVKEDSKQADHAIFSILKTMGASITYDPKGVVVSGKTLHGTTIDLEDCPDLGPILFVAAACAIGETHIIHAGRLRIKESDRIAAMEEEIRKLGVDIHSTENEVWITGLKESQIPCAIQSHNDHRIVMAMTMMSQILNIPMQIEDAQAIHKSYPRFFDDVMQMGIGVKHL